MVEKEDGQLKKIDSTKTFNIFFDFESFFSDNKFTVDESISESMLMISLYLHMYYKAEFTMKVDDSSKITSIPEILNADNNKIEEKWEALPGFKTNKDNFLPILDLCKKADLNHYVYIKLTDDVAAGKTDDVAAGKTDDVAAGDSMFTDKRNASHYILANLYRLTYGVATFGRLPQGSKILAAKELAEKIYSELTKEKDETVEAGESKASSTVKAPSTPKNQSTNSSTDNELYQNLLDAAKIKVENRSNIESVADTPPANEIREEGSYRCTIQNTEDEEDNEVFHVRYRVFDTRIIMTFVLHLGGQPTITDIKKVSAFNYRRHAISFGAEFKKDGDKTFWVVDSLKNGAAKTVKELNKILDLSKVSRQKEKTNLNPKMPGLQGNCLYTAFFLCEQFLSNNLTEDLTTGMNTIKLMISTNRPRTRGMDNSAKKDKKKTTSEKPKKETTFLRLRF
tara:strand:- start:1718 stop:3076 length:1359 start_codon:yes stop_codon:yes gene_type:complete